MPANWENSAVATGLEKGQFSFQSQRKAMPKNVQSTIALISHASKVMLKILQPGFSSTWTMNFQMLKQDLDKVEEPEIKLPTSAGSSKKQEFQKNTYFRFIDYAKAFDYGSQQTVENSYRDVNTRPPDLRLEKSVCRSRINR